MNANVQILFIQTPFFFIHFIGAKSKKRKTSYAPPQKVKETTTMKKVVKKRPWTRDEKVAVTKRLKSCFELRKVPGKAQCDECISAEPSLRGREWTNIKDFVRNQLKKTDPLDFL